MEALVAAAEQLLTVAWGRSVRLGAAERQGGTTRRSRVLRCPVEAAPRDAPATVIIKCVLGDGGETYDPEESQAASPAHRLFNEWAAAQFLGGLPVDPPLSGRIYGGDRAAGLIVLEDLGAGECLADLLQGQDRARLEAGLITYAASLGRLHAATIGREAELERRRAALGARSSSAPRAKQRLGDWLREDLPKFREGCAALEVQPATGFEDEIALVAETVREPGPFLAFAPGDTCPDNHRFADGWLRFFDFEFCSFRHALLDAAYFHVPFPTCWCVNRFLPEIPPRMEAAYRAELVKSCPEAGDDSRFHAALVECCAWWTIATVSWHLLSALKEDGPWGISTVRQRQLLRLDTFAALAARFGHLEAIGATARGMSARLRALWPPEAEMPLYPPFRGG